MVDRSGPDQYSPRLEFEHFSATVTTGSKKSNKQLDFEANIAALQELVEKMERGDYTLEESVAQFERGMALAKNCQDALRAAEVKVSKLMSTASGEQQLEAVETPAEEEQ